METFQIKNEYEETANCNTIDPFLERFPQLSIVLEGKSPFPAYSVLLGICGDGIPLMLDLPDPYLGSYLLAAEDRESNFRMLLNLLTSTSFLNNDHEVNIHIISSCRDNYLNLHQSQNLRICLTPNQAETHIAIEEFRNLVCVRKSHGNLLPFHILAVDGLVDLYNYLNPQVRPLFHWIVEHSPEVGIWVIATIETEQIAPRYFQIIESFYSRILGFIRHPDLSQYLSGIRKPFLHDLIPGFEAIEVSQGNLVSINIPQVKD